MTDTNELNMYRTISIMSIGVVVTIAILMVFFPVFSGNFFYEIGTVLIYSGDYDKIPKGWALCDGNNDTPDLTNRFIIGSWTETTIPTVEENNQGKKYIGRGISTKLIENPRTKINGTSALGLIGDNVPYVFGQKINANYKNKFLANYDAGTSWFKRYIYTKRNEKCKLELKDESENVIRDKTEIENKINSLKAEDLNKRIKVDETPKQYYKDSKNIHLCSGMTEDKKNQEKNYILNDTNMTSINSTNMITIAPTTTTKAIKNDFNYYYDLTNPEEMSIYPREHNVKTVKTEINDVKQVPSKRRLFRDYEDYKIYYEEGKRLGVSCYDCLPMNHKFNSHTYYSDRRYQVENSVDDAANKQLVQRFDNTRFIDYMKDFMYETPYSNNPSFLKLAYIIRVK